MSNRRIIVEFILIITMLSNLLASAFVIALVQLNSTQRASASAQATKERGIVICILQIQPADRTTTLIQRCKDNPKV